MLKKILFYLILIVFIICINLGYIEIILDSSLGIDWSKPISDFLKANTQGFIIILVISLYLDFIRDGKIKRVTVHGDDANNILEIIQKYSACSNTNREVIQKLLVAKYKKYEPDSLVNYIDQDKAFYTNVDVKYTLVDSQYNTDKYLWDYDIWFDFDDDKFLIAITRLAFVQDQISKTCLDINDVITVPSIRENIPEAFKVIGENVVLAKLEKTDSGTTREHKCILKPVPKRQYTKYLSGLGKEYFSDVALFSASLGKGQKRIHFSSPSIELEKADHYIYWASDRIMHLNKIEFDARGLFNGVETRFNIHPFLANYEGLRPNIPHEKCYTLEVNNWVSISQGAILSWR